MRNGKYLVFISHSSKDTWVARQIERAIVESAAVTFLDYGNIPVGANFEDQIRDALWEADEFLVLLTPWAVADHPYIWSEAGLAWGRKIPIIGILHGFAVAELLTLPNIPVYLKAS